MGNVYIIGAQSTGKTTIVNALEEAFAQSDEPLTATLRKQRPIIIREVARNVLKVHGFTRDDISTSPARALQLQQLILKAQFEAEQESLHQSTNSWFITDRSSIDPIVYAAVFVGEAAAQEMLASEEWRELGRGMKQGLVFLCEAGTKWLVDDGTRLMPDNVEKWMEVDWNFRRLLGAVGIEYHVISNQLTSISERVELIMRAIYKHWDV